MPKAYIAHPAAAHVPSVPQEALRKIITTLAVKNEETQTFIYSLKQMLLNVEVSSAGGPADSGGRCRVQAGSTPLCLLGALRAQFPCPRHLFFFETGSLYAALAGPELAL